MAKLQCQLQSLSPEFAFYSSHRASTSNTSHSHVKQYFKEQRALRTETTINNPKDFYVAKTVHNLRSSATSGSRSIANSSKSGGSVTAASSPRTRSIACSSRPLQPGQRVSALRFGDPRVMALFQPLMSRRVDLDAQPPARLKLVSRTRRGSSM